MDSNTEKVYSTKETAIRLNIAVPTVRKYAQVMESQQYKYIRSENGARLFTENDINAFHHFMELRKANISVEACAKIVTERFNQTAIQVVSGDNTPKTDQYNKQYEELKAMVQKQNELIEGLAKRLDQQQDYIENSLDRRDNTLMEFMNNTLEERKQMAASTDSTKKKKWWEKLFTKEKEPSSKK